MIKVVIFDYDGVIVDSFPTIHQVYRAICGKIGRKCPANFTDFKKAYGISSKNLTKNLGFTDAERKKANELYREEVLKLEPPFFNKIDEVIRTLKARYKLILVSSNQQKEVESKLKTLGVSAHFDLIIGGKELGPLKKSKALKELIKDLNVDEDEIVMIGDRVNDYYDAKEAGLKNIILVEYGWGYDTSSIPEHKQKIIVKKPLDIIQAVESFN